MVGGTIRRLLKESGSKHDWQRPIREKTCLKLGGQRTDALLLPEVFNRGLTTEESKYKLGKTEDCEV